MTTAEFQKSVLRTANPSTDTIPYGKLVNGALGLAGESGEVCDHVKKFLYQGHELNYDHVIEELGDVAYYVCLAAMGCGVTFDEVLLRNVEKLERRYPNGFEVERSLHREEGK